MLARNEERLNKLNFGGTDGLEGTHEGLGGYRVAAQRPEPASYGGGHPDPLPRTDPNDELAKLDNMLYDILKKDAGSIGGGAPPPSQSKPAMHHLPPSRGGKLDAIANQTRDQFMAPSMG